MSYLTNEEICFLYRTSKDKDEEIFILGELTASDPETIIEVLKDANEYELLIIVIDVVMLQVLWK